MTEDKKDSLLKEMAELLGLVKYDLRAWLKSYPDAEDEETEALIQNIDDVRRKYIIQLQKG